MTPGVAILTGRSDPGRAGLSDAQIRFLEAVVPAGTKIDLQGFPWSADEPPERDVPLALASWRNLRQWGAARYSPTYQAHCRDALERMRDRGATAVVTCSCGFDILCAGWDEAPLHVIALGPVHPPKTLRKATLTTVIGRRDWLSRALHRRGPDHWVQGGHMDYWPCLETQAIVRARLAEVL